MAYILVAIPIGCKLRSIAKERKDVRSSIKLGLVKGTDPETKTSTEELTRKEGVYPEPIELTDRYSSVINRNFML